MKTFILRLMALLQELPRIMQFTLYAAACMTLWLAYNHYSQYQTVTEQSYTNLVATSPNDTIFSSSGRTGNFIYITQENNKTKYWSDLAKLNSLQDEKDIKDGALCVYNIDFKFGYSNRASVIVDLLTSNRDVPLPTLIATNTISNNEFYLSNKGATTALNCTGYLSGHLTSLSSPNLTPTPLNTRCKANPNQCAKFRVAQWLAKDNVLKEHLKRGILTAGTAAEEFIHTCTDNISNENCQLIALNTIVSTINGDLPASDSEINKDNQLTTANKIDLLIGLLKIRLQKKLAKLDLMDMKNYDPLQGQSTNQKDAIRWDQKDNYKVNAYAQLKQLPEIISSPSATSIWPTSAFANNTQPTNNNTNVHRKYAQKISLPSSLNNAAYMMTFSTVVSLSTSKKRKFFWKDDEYAVRRDVSQVFMGSNIPKNVPTKTINIDGKKIQVANLESPKVLAINRWIADKVVMFDGKLNVLPNIDNPQHKGKSIDEVLNEKIQHNLHAAIKQHSLLGQQESKKILRDRYARNGLEFEFTAATQTSPSLLDLLKK